MTLLLGLILAPFALLTLCFAIEVVAGLRPLQCIEAHDADRPRAVVVVPAHDEEPIISASLAALKRAVGDRADILVIADNCSDSTAKLARGLSLEVIERCDADRRGKGFALDFARLHLRERRPDVIVVMDADCGSDGRSIEVLVACCVATGRPCQAVYLQSAVPDGSPLLQLSTFAFFIKNLVRQRGLQRLAGRAQLVGTGMAFPGPLFDAAALATGNIVEDLQLGLELADVGHAPLFIEQAIVWSSPASPIDTLDQRRRWEGGYLRSAARWAPRMLGRSLRRFDLRELWAAVSLLIPPLALLVLLDVGGMVLAGTAWWLGWASSWPFLMLAGSLLAAGVALLAAWGQGGSRFVSLGTLARVPLYVLWKIPLYLGLARRGAPREWLRTRRG
jgi:hypothetical protein